MDKEFTITISADNVALISLLHDNIPQWLNDLILTEAKKGRQAQIVAEGEKVTSAGISVAEVVKPA